MTFFQQLKSSRNEYLKLKARVDNLQGTQRNLLGEDLESLGIKELEHLEKQLDSSLKHIRSTRTQHMVDQLTELQKKEQMFCEANKCLRRRGGRGAPPRWPGKRASGTGERRTWRASRTQGREGDGWQRLRGGGRGHNLASCGRVPSRAASNTDTRRGGGAANTVGGCCVGRGGFGEAGRIGDCGGARGSDEGNGGGGTGAGAIPRISNLRGGDGA
ncbi:Agamous-like MADS-box protein AGL9-like protein, partial [Zea mays]